MNDNSIRYIYVGHSDPPHSPWKSIPDTPEERQKAIDEGYTAGSTMSYAYEPETGKPEPVRRGSLVLDFDSKLSPAAAVDIAREFIDRLVERYWFPPECLRYWISGGKGCHIEIPAAIYGGEAGHPELPLIQKDMLILLGILDFHNPKMCKAFDLSMYCMGKGKLLRLPNIVRPNNRYKVQVSANEFFNLDYAELERLTFAPRMDFDPGTKEPVKSPRLTEIYDIAVGWRRKYTNSFNPVSGIEALYSCAFLSHCYENQATLSEPHWKAMIGALGTFGDFGRETIHLFSRDYPGYTFEETEAKIARQKNLNGPLTCDYIKSLGFDCGKACGVRSPADLWKYRRSEETRRAMKFIHREDGLYRQTESGDSEPLKVCSPLKVLGKMRNPEGAGWARLVEITTSDGRKKEVCVFMRDMKGRGEGVISLLLDHGLELSPTSSKAQSYLMEYLMDGAPNDSPLLCVQRVGWTGDTYILPDASFGGELEEKIHFQSEGTDNLYQVSGTLAEWQEHVGRYCRGNSLLELLTSYALTGPLLKLVGLEGGGVHLFGPSATGKTTSLLIAGSICGGGGNRGFSVQWRATHNALEVIATLHNDGLLVIDEISQASGETVYHAVYMLANGQGKDRLRADASRRKTLRWLLNFLSTGEVTINDKIEELGKYSAMAGQGVRVIDLPIDGLGTENTFQNLHGLPDGSKFSELLNRNACLYYGSPLRASLTALCGDMEGSMSRIGQEMKAFIDEYCPADASGQVKRVARKIALTAAAGELGITFGVLPFEPGTSIKAAAEWFKVWLEGRNGHGNQEMIKAVKRIQDYLDRYSDSARFVNLDSPSSYSPSQLDGYTWTKGSKKHVMIKRVVFSDLIRGINRKALLDELDHRGYLAHNQNGPLLESISINNKNQWGYVFIPSAWEGEPDPTKGEEWFPKAKPTIDDIFD